MRTNEGLVIKVESTEGFVRGREIAILGKDEDDFYRIEKVIPPNKLVVERKAGTNDLNRFKS